MRLAAKEADLKPAQIASALKKNRSTVQQWFDGTVKSISGDSLTAVAKLLGVRVEWLAAGDGPMRSLPDQSKTQRENIDQGFTTMTVPDEIKPMFEAWLALHQNRPIPADLLKANTLLANSLTAALAPARHQDEDQRSE
ncbi:hypothetical protein CSQ89_20395 [Chitinimonas sp. BJB300]|nr:hypothetical protein CSQ89_20395 [Chitinimonas sp. BJB300]